MGDGVAVRILAERELGGPQTWKTPRGYPDSLALSAIDAVFSLQARYSAVGNVLDRYRAARRADCADPDTDSGPDLLAFIERGGGPQRMVDTFNRSLAPGTARSKRGPKLKISALVEGVAALAELDVATAADLREAAKQGPQETERAWRGVRGLGIASWDYLLMLVGAEGVKADTMVRRFVTRAVGASTQVADVCARSAVKDAASAMGVSERVLDHRIWRHESGRG